MFPNEILPGIDLYVICLALAAVSAIISFGKLADVSKMSAKVHNMSIYTAILAIVLGYGSAVLFQAFYNMMAGDGFSLNSSTGATFYGGLIGGVTFFVIIYFIWGKLSFDDNTYKKQFYLVLNIAPASITVAHCIGRIGCLMAGCCYGFRTDAWCGITMKNLGYKVVPTQLFEAIILAVLFICFVYRIKHKQDYNMPIYMVLYGIWRFFLEYLRNDDRGQTVISFLTPSQLIAVLMIVGGVMLYILLKKRNKTISVGNSTFIENEKNENNEKEE